jgi:hypothetical protein
MTEKPRKPAGTPPPQDPADEPGRIEPDDRGNMAWHWSDETELQEDDLLGNAERLRALVDPHLDIKPEDDDLLNPLQGGGKGLKSGYNPYNSGPLGKQSWKKKKDLRKLSEWIELKKKMESKKDSED